MNELPKIWNLPQSGIDPAEIETVELIHEKGGARLYRVMCDGRCVVVKCFADAGCVELRAYAMLESLGVPTLSVHGRCENAIVLEDLEHSEKWRLATQADCERLDVGEAVARWYQKLHQAGRTLLSSPDGWPGFLRREEDALTAKAVFDLGEKLHLPHLSVWRMAADHIEQLKQAIRRQPATLTYNDFHWSNLALSRSRPCKAIVFDYHLLGIGMAYSDYRNVLTSLRSWAARAFRDAYGPVCETQALLDAPVSVLVALREATNRPSFPRWAEDLVHQATDGRLEYNLRRAMELVREPQTKRKYNA